MNFTKLETEVFKLAISQMQSRNQYAVTEQINRCIVVGREYTGVGFELELRVNDDTPNIDNVEDFYSSFRKIVAYHPRISIGATFMCMQENFKICTLEGVTLDGCSWPQDDVLFSVELLEQ